jgi:hypothetical protein
MNARYQFGVFIAVIAMAVVPLKAPRHATAVAECPQLVVSCPDELPDADKPYVAKARITGADPNQKLTYKWTVHGGEIVDGQGTESVNIRITDRRKGVTATVEVGGLPENCSNTASCTLIVD